MKDFLVACAKELKSPLTTHVAAATAGAVGVAALHHHMMGNGRTIALCQESFDALVNDETSFVRIAPNNYEHIFRVTLEQ